jgi:hypothetical protein
VIFEFIIITTYIIKFFIYLCSKLVLSFRATFCFTNPDTTPSQLLRISEGLLVFQWVHCNWISFKCVRFQVLTVAIPKNPVFWVKKPCSLIDVYRRIRGACYLYLQGRRWK